MILRSAKNSKRVTLKSVKQDCICSLANGENTVYFLLLSDFPLGLLMFSMFVVMVTLMPKWYCYLFIYWFRLVTLAQMPNYHVNKQWNQKRTNLTHIFVTYFETVISCIRTIGLHTGFISLCQEISRKRWVVDCCWFHWWPCSSIAQ